VKLVDTNTRASLARVVDEVDSSPRSLDGLEVRSVSVYKRPVPVSKGSSVGSSPTTPLEGSLRADMPIPAATKSPTPCVVVVEISPMASLDAVFEASLDESEVRCAIADVVFRKDVLEKVPFCDDDDDDDEEEASALHASTKKNTSERDRDPI
jgi:hypothetical protein